MSELSREKLDLLFRKVRQCCPRLPVLAIPWIFSTMWSYPLKPPIGKVGPFRILLSILIRIPWLGFHAFCLFTRILCLRILWRHPLRHCQSQPFDALVKTWTFLTTEFEKDFYFGDFGNQLKERGMRLLMLYGNGTDKREWKLVFEQRVKDFPARLPEMALLSPWSVFQMIGKQYQTAWVLYFKAWKEADKTLQQLIWLASRDCLRHMTLRNGLFYWIGKEAVTRWKPKFFVTLYEGNAWEKCLALGIRASKSPCKLVGYQHTVIMPHAYELQRPSNSIAGMEPPELILNTGISPIRLLRPGHQKFPTRFLPFGTFRYRFSKQENLKPRFKEKRLLVLPEGIRQEMIFLFDAALELASLLPDYEIILRCHPAIPFQRIQDRLQYNVEKLSNVFLSKAKNVEQDLDQASLLLYRGTSTVLYAILKGLKPFYLMKNRLEANIDPLFDLTVWRERVSSVAELNHRIRVYAPCSSDLELERDWLKAYAYVQEYIQPVNSTSYDRFLEMVA